MTPFRRSWLFRIYCGVLLALSLLTFVPAHPHDLAWPALMLLALPISLTAYYVQFVGGVFLLDPSRDDWVVTVWALTVWTVAIAAQGLGLSAIVEDARRRKKL